MKTYLQILSAFEKEVEPLHLTHPYIIEHAEKGIHQCQHSLQLMREQVIKHGFKCREEEIQFFKTVKPKLVGALICYLNVHQIMSRLSIMPAERIPQYYTEQSDLLYAYFQENHELYYYFIRNHEHWDKIFFTRAAPGFSSDLKTLPFLIDSQFSTFKDMVFAQFIGNQKTLNFLIEYAPQHPHPTPLSSPSFKWTGQKVDLVELIYALQASGLVNNGNVGIKDLALAFQKMFGIAIGDYYRTFLEIRMRKSNPAKLLDTLKTSLQNKITTADA